MIERKSASLGESGQSGEVVQLPAPPAAAVDIALEQLELVYAYVYARVGNRPDAEDVTQQVALKAIPRLRAGASAPAIRAYLFAAARSALASFWAARFGLPEDELRDDLWVEKHAPEPGTASADRVHGILDQLPGNYRRVLELRFLRGYSLKEVAAELGSTVVVVKVLQLRALRAPAKVVIDA